MYIQRACINNVHIKLGNINMSHYPEQLEREESTIESFSAVNKPKHYMLFDDGTEAIDIIEAALTTEEFAGYLKGNFLKYRLRAGEKDNLQQDIDKSNWYRKALNINSFNE